MESQAYWQRSVELGYIMDSAMEESFAANLGVMLIVYSMNVLIP